MSYVIDTHALLWYVTNNKQLSSHAEKILDEAHHTVNSIILLPSIMLMEAIDVLEKGKVSYQIGVFLNAIRSGEQYELSPITWDIVEAYSKDTYGFRNSRPPYCCDSSKMKCAHID